MTHLPVFPYERSVTLQIPAELCGPEGLEPADVSLSIEETEALALRLLRAAGYDVHLRRTTRTSMLVGSRVSPERRTLLEIRGPL